MCSWEKGGLERREGEREVEEGSEEGEEVNELHLGFGNEERLKRLE